MPSSYESYVCAEWDMFIKDPARAAAMIEAVKGHSVRFVLDVGCGAGQELLPFVKEFDAFGIGLDISPEAGKAGAELFQKHAAESRVIFIRGASEKLPFLDGTLDVVVSRLSLPYTNNHQALSEISRVLKAGGILFLKIHHARYYVKQLLSGIKNRNVKSVVHALRVLLNGSIYFWTGHQPMNHILGRETFKTRRRLMKELMIFGLGFRDELSDSNPSTPSFVFCKHPRSYRF